MEDPAGTKGANVAHSPEGVEDSIDPKFFDD